MSKRLERSIKLYNGKAYGHEVSKYGLEHGYLDYFTLSKIIGDSIILGNELMEHTGYENWDLYSGYEELDDEYVEVYQYYIISGGGADFLAEYTDELVYYNEQLNLYLWGITHFGTSWDYVLTDIKLLKEED